MNVDFEPSELSDLITRVQADGASAAEEQRLIELLNASAEARRQYVNQVIVSVLLSEGAGDLFDSFGSAAGAPFLVGEDAASASLHDAMILPALIEEPGPEIETSARSPLTSPLLGAGREMMARNPWRRRRWMGLAAVLLAALFLAGILKRSPGSATLVGAIDAKWGNASPAIAEGKILPPSELELTAGLVQIQFSSGARAVVEGPARFRAQPPNRLSLVSGKVSALVPEQAHGFTVATASASFVDLGTEFGVRTAPGGDTDLTVFQGSVSVSSKAGPSVAAPAAVVTAGSAQRISSAGVVSAVAPTASSFVLARDFDIAAASAGSEGYKRWRSYSERIRRDSSLIAYYTFDNAAQAPDRLLNRSPAGHSLDGVLGDGDPAAKPRWGTGRFPEKGALLFHASTSERVVIPDSPALNFSRGSAVAKPFTLCVWAKAGLKQSDGAGILCHGGWYAEQYAIDLRSPGVYRSWVRNKPGGVGNVIDSGGTPQEAWCFIASVYDPSLKMLSLYVDGRPRGTTAAPQALLAADGGSEIGSRRGPRGKQSWVTFDGLIDEVAIFGRALSAAEVSEAHEAGTPDHSGR